MLARNLSVSAWTHRVPPDTRSGDRCDHVELHLPLRLAGGSVAVGLREMPMHRRTSRMRIELHEHLPQHLAPQALTQTRYFARRVGRALFAAESDFYANIWVGFFVARHMRS